MDGTYIQDDPSDTSRCFFFFNSYESLFVTALSVFVLFAQVVILYSLVHETLRDSCDNTIEKTNLALGGTSSYPCPNIK